MFCLSDQSANLITYLLCARQPASVHECWPAVRVLAVPSLAPRQPAARRGPRQPATDVRVKTPSRGPLACSSVRTARPRGPSTVARTSPKPRACRVRTSRLLVLALDSCTQIARTRTRTGAGKKHHANFKSKSCINESTSNLSHT